MTETTPRWTEIEHLPEWDEEFYDIYTARKLGKWVMLKTLKPEYKDNPEYRRMIEKEFDVRYNLAHPNIVMINDFEDVPGVGLSIVCDDVYGTSLRKLIDTKAVTAAHIDQLRRCLPAALEYIQTNHIVHHPLRPERIIFTENIGNLKLIDVGFDQRASLSPAAACDDIRAYGEILLEALDASDIDDPALRAVAQRCLRTDRRRIADVPALQLALSGRGITRLYGVVIAFLVIMVGVLGWLSARPIK
ncbi:MAG: serine/threonine protein kinase [Bacteroides sp.]|nr:serine/threonine protein kinase [Bacteroides sp.]MDE6043202.1 serine/threonine-protein kinase [Muribaculaceae bacterium]